MIINGGPITSTQQHERLEALYHLAVELTALRDLKSVLDTALRHCLELTESQFGFIGLNTANGKAMDVAAIQGFHPANEFYKDFHLIPLRPNIFARVVLENRPIRSDDARKDPTRVGQPKGHPPVRAFLGVPLLIREKPVGMIGVANRPITYDDEHEQLLVTYAAQVSIVIRNVQLYEELAAAKDELSLKVNDRTQQLQEAKEALSQKAAQLQDLLKETVDIQEKERQRISQDIHDGINQLIIGGLLELKSGRERIKSGNITAADKSLEAVQKILHRVEGELRRIIHDLRPPTLDSLGLAPALRIYSKRFEQYSGIACDFFCEGEPFRLPPPTEIGLYRLAQEALQNISVHSQSQSAKVHIRFCPEQITLSIADQGRGFDKSQVFEIGGRHFGLMSMQERADSFGGDLRIDSRPGEGTQVYLMVPINHQSKSPPAL